MITICGGVSVSRLPNAWNHNRKILPTNSDPYKLPHCYKNKNRKSGSNNLQSNKQNQKRFHQPLYQCFNVQRKCYFELKDGARVRGCAIIALIRRRRWTYLSLCPNFVCTYGLFVSPDFPGHEFQFCSNSLSCFEHWNRNARRLVNLVHYIKTLINSWEAI